MTDWRTIRVAMAVAVVFASGVAVGRMTAPTKAGAETSAGRPMIPRGGRVQNAEAMLGRMTEELKLTQDQLAQVRPIVREWAEEAKGWPANSPGRHAVAERHLARVRGLLKPEQLPAFDEALEKSRLRLGLPGR